MTLLDIWKSLDSDMQTKRLPQLIAIAGDGKLRDGNTTSSELRGLLSSISAQALDRFAQECLNEKFPDNGLALQDVVNEVGKRLGFVVQPGRYRGVPGEIGFDGIWTADNHAIVVEAKTTADLGIPVDKYARYRRALIKQERLDEDASSILIVVGRGDTGAIEAQVRGSKHASDVRLISVAALFRLLSIKHDLEDPMIADRIRTILAPREYTLLDEIVDLLFSTAEEVKQEEDEASDGDDEETATSGPKFTPVDFHQACVDRIEVFLGTSLVKRSRASFTTPDGATALVCIISRRHERGSTYWYAFHPHQKAQLEEADSGYIAFGCGGPEKVLLVPFKEFARFVPHLNTTEKDDRFYWHIHIAERDKQLLLRLKGGAEPHDLSSHLI